MSRDMAWGSNYSLGLPLWRLWLKHAELEQRGAMKHQLNSCNSIQQLIFLLHVTLHLEGLVNLHNL